MLTPLLLILTAFLATVSADTLTKAKLHSWRNYNLCVGLSDGTYNRIVQLRPCSHETATWVINDVNGTTFIRNRNQCLNGGWVAPDWGFNIANGNDAYAQLCQDEALRSAYNLWNEIAFPWRWFRKGDQFELYGFEQTNWGPCLDVKDGHFWNGAPLQIWQCHDASNPDYANQRFNIEWLGPEY